MAGARLEAVAALAERFGLSMPRRVVESRAASTPFLVGVVRPVLVLPMGWAPDRKVILHELIHLKQRDVAAGWVTALFRCVHWCNPFLWRIFDRIDNQREQRCDQLVLERLEGEDRRDYGRVLLSMADDGRRRFPAPPPWPTEDRTSRHASRPSPGSRPFPGEWDWSPSAWW